MDEKHHGHPFVQIQGLGSKKPSRGNGGGFQTKRHTAAQGDWGERFNQEMMLHLKCRFDDLWIHT